MTARFPLMFDEYQEPKERRRGINRYILCDVGEGEMCVCHVCMCVCLCVRSVRPVLYLTVTPSFSSTRTPFSWYSSRVSQKLSLSFMMSASTAPPRNTMCLRRGGSSILILNFWSRDEVERRIESVNREKEEIIMC